MNKYWKIDNFDLKIEDKTILAGFSLDFCESTCLLGESGSGKSLLLKELVKNHNYIGNVSFYFGEAKASKNWKEEVHYSQLSQVVQNFLDIFLEPTKSFAHKYAIVLKLLSFPDFFFCEDLHGLLSRKERMLLFCFLKEQHILIFYVTNDIEDTVTFDYLIVLKNNNIAMEGKTLLVLKEEKLMKLLGFSLPFYVNMSRQLSYYGLLEDVCLSKEELEDKLWPSK